MKELGLLDCPNSPVLNRRELPFASNAGEEVTSAPPSTPSPAVSLTQLHSKSPSSTSASNSTELLIIEDEEEYLISQLAVDNPPSSLEEKTDEVTPGTSGEFYTDDNVIGNFDSKSAKDEELSNNNLSSYKEQESKSFNSNNNLPTHFINDTESEKEEEKINNDSYYYDKATSEAELLFNSLKHSLERPDVTLEGECPLTESLKYLDAALSLFQLEDMPSRPSDTPRSKASTKRRLYSTASPLSLLTPEPSSQSAATSVEHDDRCEECGSVFPLPSARFCCICGTRRPL